MGTSRGALFPLAATASALLGIAAALLSVRRDHSAEGQPRLGSDARSPGSRSHRSSAIPTDPPPVRLSLSAQQGSIPGLSLDSTAPDYDAKKLIRLLGSVKAVFDAEPRNPTWARAVEERVTRPYEEAMRGALPQIRQLTMDCRSTMCAINWTLSPDDEVTRTKARFVALQLFPGTAALTPEGGLMVRWDNLSWKGDIRDSEAFIAQVLHEIARSAPRMRNRDLSWISRRLERDP